MGAREDKGKGKWEEAKGKAKQAWGDITEDDEAQVSGEAEETKGKGRQKWGEAKEWVEEKTGDEERP
jgi:uncharacterized protein YjbJ (UPF0337 family)